MTAYFDEIDVREHMNERAAAFQQLSPEDREVVEKAIVQYANDNDGSLLFALRLTGRETDSALANELHTKYQISPEKIRIANEMFHATYAMWEINNLVIAASQEGIPTTQQLDEIRQRLALLEESADFLEHFQIPATHVTNEYAGSQIAQSEILRKSDSGDASHYEGDGVYAGVLGSFKDWSAGDTFEFTVPYADTLPIIVSYNYPKAMVNILGEGLDIQKRETIIATASGLQQWRQLEFTDDPLETWKVMLLEEILGTPIEVYVDSDGIKTLVADTDREPIHWAMACRSLRIPRFIPKSELSKSDIIYQPAELNE